MSTLSKNMLPVRQPSPTIKHFGCSETAFLLFSHGPMERVVMAAVTVGAAVTIIAVHWDQTRQRQEMHKGVLRDIDRQKAKAALKEQEEQQKRGNSHH